MSESKHTRGPWEATDQGDVVMGDDRTTVIAWCGDAEDNSDMGEVTMHANARLIAAAPHLFDVAVATRKLVSEAAMTGFNCHDGDWAARLFANQAELTTAIEAAAPGYSAEARTALSRAEGRKTEGGGE